MFFKFIMYNLIFQLILSMIFISKFIVFDIHQLTEHAMTVFYLITLFINIPFYLIIKYEKKLLSNFKNIIKKNK